MVLALVGRFLQEALDLCGVHGSFFLSAFFTRGPPEESFGFLAQAGLAFLSGPGPARWVVEQILLVHDTAYVRSGPENLFDGLQDAGFLALAHPVRPSPAPFVGCIVKRGIFAAVSVSVSFPDFFSRVLCR